MSQTRALLFLVPVATVMHVGAMAQTTVRASVSTAGAQANNPSFSCSISGDGRCVAFSSAASSLVPEVPSGEAHIYVRELDVGVTTRVSVTSDGFPGDGMSSAPSISGDGRWVAFESYANNLVVAPSNSDLDVFVHDRSSRTTVLASAALSGSPADDLSYQASISADGRFVAFASRASNLVPNDSNSAQDVFVRDLTAGTTVRVSVGSQGQQGFEPAWRPSLSADGRHVAFYTESRLVSSDVDLLSDVYVHDRVTGETSRVSVTSSGAAGSGSSSNPSISYDGRYVVFESTADLAPLATNGCVDIFVRDRSLLTTSLVSIDATGGPSNQHSYRPSISADGQFVLFVSDATDLVPGDTNGDSDCFVRNRQSNSTVRVSVADSGAEADFWTDGGSLSADGRSAAFTSLATNLVPQDTNNKIDVFVHRAGTQAFPAFCFGDGSGSACPCGNAGASGNGCANSVNGSGANLAASGLASTTVDSLVLHGSGMPNGSALYFQGTERIGGGAGSPFGDGLRCAGGTLRRLGVAVNVGGASTHPRSDDPSISIAGSTVAGDVRTYQCWYRNAEPTYCTPQTFNWTNAVEATWLP